jgi:REP element-mobilizing transposase RayT
MQVYLVFVTIYRHCNLGGEAIEPSWWIDGQGNHVHLPVSYLPKVSVSSLVNSLKGVSGYVLRRQLPRMASCYWKKSLWSPSDLAASGGGAPLEVFRRYSQALPQ